MKKPNILFIMSDQFRYDALGSSGNIYTSTPNYDKLADMGVRFNNAYTPDPICVPARASITTGFYPHKCLKTKENTGSIKKGYPLLGDELNKRGYETYAIGKLHYHPYVPAGKKRTTHGLKHVELMESGRIINKYNKQGNGKGLEDYYDYLFSVGWGGYTRAHGLGNNDVFAAASRIPQEHYVDKWVADRAIANMTKHIENYRQKPFFMWASFPKPHSAYDPPQPYDTLYDPRNLQEPVGDVSVLSERGLDLLVERQKEYLWKYISTQAKRTIKAHYYGLITFQDKQVGRMLDFLESRGLIEDTIIVFTADHGDMMGDFGLYFKEVFYNGAVKVPLIISYPGKIEKGKVSNELAGLQDIMPTILSLAGEPIKRELDGKDLTPVLTENKYVRDYYISQCNDDPRQQYMIADKQWKYIYHQYGGVEELYSVSDDPQEINNLSQSIDKEVISAKIRLKDQLINWCIENEDKDIIRNQKLRITQKVKGVNEKSDNPFGRRFY